ncbi:MAG: SDR family oxidoreductase [Bacteroidia bacterium]|nr:SDR family oxidoreductase [Bacteroidia bacterium]GIV24148.1 MAG: enoyl-[acyl-carrier-protein] reductase [NADH] [Bacteroidia bacterium]
MAYGLLKGKCGIITGALDEKSIAWHVARRAHEEGAHVIMTNAPVALRLGKPKELAESLSAPLIPADLTQLSDIERLYDETLRHTGRPIDFLLHSVGMSPNVRKGKAYPEIDYEFYFKTLDVSAISFHKLLQVGRKKGAFARGASIVALSYIAAQRVFPKYGDMSDAKALLESIARMFGYFLGKELGARVNIVSQSPTPTTAGTGIAGFDKMYDYAHKMSPLGNASAEACADFVVALFSDLTRSITLQTLYHDGGFSAMGISEDLL